MTDNIGTGEEGWLCGAFEPPRDGRGSYRCTGPAGHGGSWHHAEVDGEVVASWLMRHPT